MFSCFYAPISEVFVSRYGTKVEAAAVRLKAQGKWTVPHWRRGHGSIWDAVVGSCPGRCGGRNAGLIGGLHDGSV